ncbi:neural cell adhesion molecule 2-like isoform X2 [Babylonia areolata]|uniref:neural cell adhesion molecule 2-like isoform X2 n=1 Tax=Babylonia areolata TaxID=304850 RepID=UPI003FD652B7
MITMELFRFLLAPTLLVMLTIQQTGAELVIFPREKKTLQEGQPLLLTCEHSVQGKTAQDVQMKWFTPLGEEVTAHMGTRFVEYYENSASLKITSVATSDEGNYKCTAMINGSLQEEATYVEVFENVEFLSPPEQSVINGTTARVWCRTSTTSRPKTMKWYARGDRGILETLPDKCVPGYETNAAQVGNYLEIINVDLSDSKTYVCSLEFKRLGETRNYDINVIVTVPPKIMPIHLDPTSPKEGDRLLMSCKAEGIPPPTYMFYKGNRPLMEQRSTDGEYVIENLKRTDEGVYSCNAMNKGGNQSETLNLDVKILPSFENTANLTQKEGTSVRLPCIATADPVASMSWRRKGSKVDYLFEGNSDSDIYVEEVTDDPIEDGPTMLYRRTMYLVINVLKSEHAGEYVCKADNEYGKKERTFKIDVTYAPNFNDQGTSVFYGWVNSKTNLTCIANGNPEPLITWFRNEQDVSKLSGYTITVGHSGINTRAISYLQPVVDNANVDSVFGEYKCQAGNKFGTPSQMLTFRRADVPEVATVSLLESKATMMVLRIYPPANNGGQPVTNYTIKYGPSGSSKEPLTKVAQRFPSEDSTEVTLNNLTAKTDYSIKVYAHNAVGQGKGKKIVEPTKDYTVPEKVKVLSSKQGLSANTYTLQWNIPLTGGKPISNYVVEYAKAKVDATSEPWKVVRVEKSEIRNVDGQRTTQITLTGLQRETYYSVTVKAVSSMGASEETKFIFKTGRGDDQSVEDDEPALGAGGIVGLLIVILLLLALAVDAAFFKTKQCGLIWTISQALGRKDEGAAGASKSPEDGDEAAAKLLGKEKDDTLRTENEVDKEAAEPAKAAEEGGEGEGGQAPEEKKELEPEDKEERLDIDVASEPAAPAKEAETPAAKEPAEETTPPAVETKPPAEEKADKPASA